MNQNFDQQSFGFESVPPATPPSSGRGFAIASLVCGIVGILMCCCCMYWLNMILGVLAVVFSIVSARMSHKMHGLAIAGLILGILAILIFIVFFAFEMWVRNLSQEAFDAWIGDAIRDSFGEDVYNKYINGMGFSFAD